MSQGIQTEKSFRDKWTNNQSLAFDQTISEDADIFNWIVKRNGWDNADELAEYLGDKRRILDAGCGNGRATALLRKFSDEMNTEVVGIDLVAHKIAEKNLSDYKNINCYGKNLLEDLSVLGKFDFIYCQEVLHHTGDPAKAFWNLSKILDDDGEIAIYVYKKKAPIREFTDEFLRNKISHLSYEKTTGYCDQITELGKVLSELNVKVQIPAVDLLEIEAGEYDIQRFIYHFFMKCFWNESMPFGDNSAINYDWYHPQDCTKHTIEEVREWFAEANLEIVHEYVDFYGITVRGKKQG